MHSSAELLGAFTAFMRDSIEKANMVGPSSVRGGNQCCAAGSYRTVRPSRPKRNGADQRLSVHSMLTEEGSLSKRIASPADPGKRERLHCDPAPFTRILIV